MRVSVFAQMIVKRPPKSLVVSACAEKNATKTSSWRFTHAVIGVLLGKEEGGEELLESQMLEGVLSHFGQVVSSRVAVVH